MNHLRVWFHIKEAHLLYDYMYVAFFQYEESLVGHHLSGCSDEVRDGVTLNSKGV